MDARLIGAVTPVDVVGSMARGNELAAQTLQMRDQNALRNVYRTQGAGLLQGNQQSLNALAAIDPAAALGIQNNVLQNQTVQRQFEIMNAQEKRAIAEASARMDEQQRAQAAEAVKREVFKFIAAPSPEVFDQLVTQAGKPELVGQWANRQVLGAEYVSSVEEALKLGAGPEQPKPADDYQRYVQEETAAGRTPMTRIEFAQAIKGKGMTVETVNPDGSRTIVSQGGPAGGPAGQTVGDVYKPGTTDQAIELIDQIANSPALERITGPYMGGGGNNIDDLNMFQRGVYGAEGLDTIEKINQLQSQAWMAARAMLKGGGQITDYESKKAEAAVARLSRAKGTEEFRAALKDLRDAITEGEAKLRAAQGGQAATPTTPQTPATETLSDEELMQQLLGGN